MIGEIENDIIGRARTISDLKTVGSFQGDVELLAQMPMQRPSFHVVLLGLKFGPKKTLGTAAQTADLAPGRYTTFLMVQNLKSFEAGKNAAYPIIEDIYTKFMGWKVPSLSKGWLWPDELLLVYAKDGLYGYQFNFNLNGASVAVTPG